MKRIFVTLSVVSFVFLAGAFALGLAIGDAAARDEATQGRVGWHIDLGMAALVFSALVHAVVLTYFMGTGRWIEETSRAYRLPDAFQSESRLLKYRTIPAMVAVLVLLVLTAALGSAADPASPSSAKTWFGFAPSTVHLALAITALGGHLAITYLEYCALHRNGELIAAAMSEVRRMRLERGLPV